MLVAGIDHDSRLLIILFGSGPAFGCRFLLFFFEINSSVAAEAEDKTLERMVSIPHRLATFAKRKREVLAWCRVEESWLASLKPAEAESSRLSNSPSFDAG